MTSPVVLSDRPEVMEYLLQCTPAELAKEIFADLPISTERGIELFDAAMAYADGDLALSEIPELFAEAFEVPEDKAKAISARFLGRMLWPLRTFDAQIIEEYSALGGKLHEVTEKKLSMPVIGAKEAAEEVLKNIGHEASDFFVQRLGLLLLQYHRGEKTSDTLATFLGRPLSIGGLALSKEEIDRALAAIAEIAHGQSIISDTEFAQQREKFDAERTPVGQLDIRDGLQGDQVAPRKVVALKSVEKRLEEDIPTEAIQKTKETTALMVPYAAAYEQALEATLAGMPEVVGAHRQAEQKLIDIVGMAIRGVRDIYQTRDTLKAQMKFTDVELQGVMAAIGKGIELYLERGGGQKKESVPEPVAEAIEEIEAAAFDRRFAALTGKAPQEKAAPLMPGARVSAARTVQQEVSQAFAKVPEETMRQAETALRPAPAKVELTVGSVAPEAQHALTDVVPTNRLHGPIEQLGTLGPAEFRRLHPTPEQAAAMVERLINDLQSTAIEERIKGIKAWRMSPLNALYAEIATEALTAGKSVAEVATARRAKGAPSLSPAEMKAVVDLNARLRF